MRQLGTAILTAIGVMALVGGLCALVYGLAHPGPTLVSGLGPLNGLVPAENYCFAGGVLAALGSGLATFGLLLRPRSGKNEGRPSP
jgi:hypothetical protein